ncbi:hypothetical protein ACFXGI_34740 [Streptomyces sp. NPDC059355]|uniref:hypothetical protein n=1 Tax=Streptomyces sp. NPDC059355 TaxID=3346811 RepID=UPI00369DC5E4
MSTTRTTWVSLTAPGESKGFDWAPLWVLAGVLLTGFFALAGHYLVQRGARHQAKEQAARDLHKWHRDLRRQSYVDCIVTYEKMRDLISPLARAIPWPVSRALTPEEASQLNDLLLMLAQRYDDAFQKCQVVRLEGPEAVADAAHQLIFAAAGFLHAADERAKAARAGQQPAHSPEPWNASAGQMNNALEEFIKAARTVIAVD